MAEKQKQYTYEQGLEFLAQHWDVLYSFVKYKARGNKAIEDALVDVIVDKVPRAFELYNDTHESGATLEEYVIGSMRRYVFKSLSIIRRQAMRFKSLPENYDCADARSVDQYNSLEDCDEVQYLLSDLDEYERWLLLTYAEGFTFTEIAEHLDVSKGTTRNHYADIMERVRGRIR